jgi:hypothetical protein
MGNGNCFQPDALPNFRSPLQAYAWQSASTYPDASDFPETELLADRPSIAISFSGGGARSFNASLGYLAALHQLDLLKNVRYIGGISGGCWATLAYSYLQHLDIPDEVFLGPIIPPNEITMKKLEVMDKRCGRRVTVKSNVVAFLDSSGVGSGKVSNFAEQWVHVTFKRYLAPFGVHEHRMQLSNRIDLILLLHLLCLVQ